MSKNGSKLSPRLDIWFLASRYSLLSYTSGVITCMSVDAVLVLEGGYHLAGPLLGVGVLTVAAHHQTVVSHRMVAILILGANHHAVLIWWVFEPRYRTHISDEVTDVTLPTSCSKIKQNLELTTCVSGSKLPPLEVNYFDKGFTYFHLYFVQEWLSFTWAGILIWSLRLLYCYSETAYESILLDFL